MAKKRCVVCGAEFAAPPSSKRITCSEECSSIRKSESHRGKSNKWGEETKARWAARGKTPNLQLGTPTAQARYRVRNLRKFCRDNEALFAPDPWWNAAAGLRQVQSWLMGKRPRTVSRWKDWTLERPAVYPDEADEL